MFIKKFHVLYFGLVYFIFSVSQVQSEKLSSHNSLHHANAIGVIKDFIKDVSTFQNFNDPITIINVLSKLGFDKKELISMLVRAATDKCLHDLIYTIESVPNISQLWAIHMLDSYGKPESGALNGNVKWMGDFSECINVYAPPKESAFGGNFHGQYCTLAATVNLSSIALPISTAVCLPDSCNPTTLLDDVEKLLNVSRLAPYIEQLDGVLNFTSLTCTPNSKHFSTGSIFMIFLLSFVGFLAFIGTSITIYEYIYFKFDPRMHGSDFIINEIKENETYSQISDDTLILSAGSNQSKVFFKHCKEFLKCFCMLSNGQKLLDTTAGKDQLLSIHGIRFLSMCWVIVCHTYAFCFGSISNIVEVLSLIDNWPFLLILQGFYSVDSFFVLSGFLLSYLFFQEYKKRGGNFPWLPFYIHRYVRLTPIYMVVLGFTTVLFPYMGSGPLWPTFETEPICEKGWWWNILYINNFAPSNEQCVGWAWYLANDMQFFVISPLFLITLWRWPKVGFSLLGLTLLGSFVANFALTYHYDIIAGLTEVLSSAKMEMFLSKFNDFFNYLYIKPYTRISPYLVGIALGYYLFKKKLNPGHRDSWTVLTCGWLLSTALTLICIFSLYHRHLSLVETSFYNALNRTCFALSLAWVIYVCLTDQGGPVNAILSHKLFMPLGRLTYTAYLIHPLVLSGYFANLKAPMLFSHMSMITLFFGFLVITYALSLVVSLLFEAPIIKMEKLLRGKRS